MLMAFITMNMSNSDIPSAKVNPVSRTFPPLFTIKISEEEKIAKDLHEIKSMQLNVQIIMIIVCILIAFIVMYYCCKKFSGIILLSLDILTRSNTLKLFPFYCSYQKFFFTAIE